MPAWIVSGRAPLDDRNPKRQFSNELKRNHGGLPRPPKKLQGFKGLGLLGPEPYRFKGLGFRVEGVGFRV